MKTLQLTTRGVVLAFLLFTVGTSWAAERFAYPRIHADNFDVKAYQGKTVYLDFWASWCIPCKDSFPWLNEMQQKYGKAGLVVVGISVDENRKDAEHFLESFPAGFSVVFDTQNRLAKNYQLKGMPSSLVIGPDGKVAHRHIGFRKSQIKNYEQSIINTLNTTGRR